MQPLDRNSWIEAGITPKVFFGLAEIEVYGRLLRLVYL